MRMSRPLPIVIGLSLLLLTGVADATSTTCTSTTTACSAVINSSSGVAIHGEANTGIGIRGTSAGSTGFYGATSSGSPFFPGVEGESLDQTGDDAAGAFGLSAAGGGPAPAYGVLAYGSAYGVYGSTAGSGTGAEYSPGSVAVAGFDTGGAVGSDTNVGALGQSSHGTGVLGLSNATQINAYTFGKFPIGVIGEAEADRSAGYSAGILALSDTYALTAYNPNTNVEVDIGTGSAIIDASGLDFSVDNSGNISAKSITTAKGTYARTTGSSGTARTLYAAHTTSPVTEDFGEGQLVNGRGYVRLDPALADVIDNRNAYHVFLTPEGDSKGLYVTQKSPAGFMVRESSGGRSTLAFEYRILAKPFDENGQRLAIAPPLPHAVSMMRQAHLRAGNATALLPFDPFARLKRKLGPAAYARALKRARSDQGL